MLVELKTVLENLNSALCDLQNKVAEADKAKGEYDTLKMKLGETETALKAKADNLNEREGKIKHIESIADFAEQAKKLMAEAKAMVKDADKRQEILEEGFKKIAEEKAKITKELADGRDENKKQANALIKERKDFEDKMKAYKMMAAAAEKVR